MKAWLFILFVIFHYSSISQVSDSCIGTKLKEIEIFPDINGFSYKDSLYLNTEAFNDRMELSFSNSKIDICGYKILINCKGCDIVEFSVCGSTVSEKHLKWLNTSFATKSVWLEFYDITVNIQGQKYFAHPFIVFPIK